MCVQAVADIPNITDEGPSPINYTVDITLTDTDDYEPYLDVVVSAFTNGTTFHHPVVEFETQSFLSTQDAGVTISSETFGFDGIQYDLTGNATVLEDALEAIEIGHGNNNLEDDCRCNFGRE